MTDFGPWWWWIVLAVGAGLLAYFNIIASAIRNGTAVHELKLNVHALRLKYMAQLRAAEVGDNPHDLPTDMAGLKAYLDAHAPLTVGEAEDVVIEAKAA